jgi:integrase
MRRPTGSIDQLPDGRYRLRVTVRGERRTVATYATREEADECRRATLAELERRGAAVAREPITVAAWGSRWLDERERDDVSDRGRWRLHVEADPIGRLSLRRVTRGDVLAWLARLRARTSERTGRALAGQSLRNVVAVLRGALAHAVDHGHLRDNPAEGLRIAGAVLEADPWTWLPPADLERLAAALPSPERHLVAFAAGSGLRAGELVALRLVDVEDDSLLVRFGAPGRPTKTRRIRRVPLLPLARAALTAWRAETAAWPNPLGLAFPGRHGAHRSRAHVIRWDLWRRACAALGRSVRWHDLRHTCASSLVSGAWGRSWSLEEVREVLGHTSIAVTQRYAHLGESAVARAARETPGGQLATQSAREPSKPGGESARKSARLLGSRFRELNSRPTVYETVAIASDPEPLRAVRPIRGRCLAILEAAARGEPTAAPLAALRADLAEQLERLAGPHALAEVARLAEDT